MDWQIFLAMVLTIMPLIELRGGLPVVVNYVIKNNLMLMPYFFAVIFLNILIIFIAFFFFDFLHEKFLKIKFYEKFIGKYLEKIKKKGKKIEKRMRNWGYFALAFFVAIPLPGTGAWTGTAIAWFLGLKRSISVLAIILGIVISGIIVLLLSLGYFSFFS